MSVAAPEATDLYRAQFEAFEGARPAPEWLARMRRDGLARFAARGFPGPREEEWRFTNVAPLARTAFRRPGAVSAEVPLSRLKQLDFGGAFAGWELVFVDGRLDPALSSAAPTAEVQILSLRQVLEREPARLEAQLARVAGAEDGPFGALNSAFLEDGALVEIAAGATPSAAIHLIYFSSGRADAPSVSHPRTLVLAGRGSQATLVETYAGGEGGVYFTNAVTEIAVGEGAVLDHYKLQRESEHAFHVAGLHVRQERGSVFSNHSICIGGGLVRNDIVARFAGEGGECVLNGLFVGDGEQHQDSHTLIDHAVPRCVSRELYKGILGGRARGVFHGRILVRKDAQKTDAQQVNKNLLLSRTALVNSTPQLEILADDVRCKHGSTTGQLDAGALFYLRSRGIGEATARALLTYAFASDVVNRIKLQPIRVALEAFLHHRLPAQLEPAAAGVA